MIDVIYERVFIELSIEEDKTAQLLSTGKLLKEISSIKDRAMGTLNAQRDAIYRKLEINNVSELTWKYAKRRYESKLPLESEYIKTALSNYDERKKREKKQSFLSIALLFLFSTTLLTNMDMRRNNQVRLRSRARVEMRARVRDNY